LIGKINERIQQPAYGLVLMGLDILGFFYLLIEGATDSRTPDFSSQVKNENNSIF